MNVSESLPPFRRRQHHLELLGTLSQVVHSVEGRKKSATLRPALGFACRPACRLTDADTDTETL